MSPLEPWIIEKIKQEEERKRREKEERDRPQPTIPLHDPFDSPPPEKTEEPEERRGPVEIDIGGNSDEDDDGNGHTGSKRGAGTYVISLI